MRALVRILSEGFRAFFLLAGLYGAVAGLVWTAWLGLPAPGAELALSGIAAAPYEWHAHEMIFGFAAAAIGGFLLTAVPNWTGAPSARLPVIALAAGLWLAGRIALGLSAHLPPYVVALADLSFVPVLLTKVLSQLLKRPKPQNLIFLVFLAAFWVGNLMVHLEWMGLSAATLDRGLRVGLLTLAGLILVLGGRITPAFTRNAMQRAGVPQSALPVRTPRLDRLTLVLSVLMPWPATFPFGLDVAAGLAVLLGALQALRLARWRGGWTVNQPILLSLHAALGLLASGLLLWGAARFGLGSEVAALHWLGIGGVGTMTLAVMSRAALGHSGRELRAPKPVALAYGTIALAAVLRWAATAVAGAWSVPLLLAAAILWDLAFILFLLSLWPVLTGPRLPAR